MSQRSQNEFERQVREALLGFPFILILNGSDSFLQLHIYVTVHSSLNLGIKADSFFWVLDSPFLKLLGHIRLWLSKLVMPFSC